MRGLSTIGNISLGLAFVAGKKRVPRPATGNTAVRISFVTRHSPVDGGSMIARRTQVNGSRFARSVESCSTECHRLAPASRAVQLGAAFQETPPRAAR